VEEAIVYLRGPRVQMVLAHIIKIFGFLILLVGLIKSSFNGGPIILSEWKLLLGAGFIYGGGHFLGRSTFLKNLLSIKSAAFSRHRSKLILRLLIFSMVCIASLKILTADISIYKHHIFGEGNILEYSQALLLIFSTLLSYKIWKALLIKPEHMKLSSIYILIAGLLLILTLEELAWGQVIFNWQTPESLININAQRETTLHNINFFQNILDFTFFYIVTLIFLLSALGPYVLSNLEKRRVLLKKLALRNFLPPRYSLSFFGGVTIVSFFVATELLPTIIINRDQEWGELLLYLGFFLTLLRTYILLGDFIHNRKEPNPLP